MVAHLGIGVWPVRDDGLAEMPSIPGTYRLLGFIDMAAACVGVGKTLD